MIVRSLLNFAVIALMLTLISCKKVKVDSDMLDNMPISSAVEKDGQLFLHGKDVSAIFSANSCRVESGGVQIVFPQETLRSNEGIWHLPKHAELLKCLFEPQTLAVKTIVIDPGHGGNDPGAISVSKKAKEKDLNLDLALKLGAELQKHGFNVCYTRDDDSTLALNHRGGRFKADLFVSIHHNASKNISASGAETYCLLSNDAADKERIVPAFQIACEMQKWQSQATGNYGRGVKFASFRVLKDAKCPAILFETGFITHPDEEKRCLSDRFRQVMAQALAQGIVRGVSPSKR